MHGRMHGAECRGGEHVTDTSTRTGGKTSIIRRGLMSPYTIADCCHAAARVAYMQNEQHLLRV